MTVTTKNNTHLVYRWKCFEIISINKINHDKINVTNICGRCKLNLKILYIDVDNLRRNDRSTENVIQSRIMLEADFKEKTFYVFRAYVKSNSESFGVQSEDGEVYPLSDSLERENKQLLKCRYIVVDTISRQVYYDGSLEDTRELLKELFDIESKSILVNIEVDEFVRLKKMRIRTINIGQMSDSDLDSRYSYKNDFIDDIASNTGEIESTNYEIIFKKSGALINRDRFKEVVRDCQVGLRTITAEGFDKDGNVIKLSSQISKKITILESESSWIKRLELEPIQVLNAILEVRK